MCDTHAQTAKEVPLWNVFPTMARLSRVLTVRSSVRYQWCCAKLWWKLLERWKGTIQLQNHISLLAAIEPICPTLIPARFTKKISFGQARRTPTAACGALATTSIVFLLRPFRNQITEVFCGNEKPKTRRRMARERRGAGSSLVSMETPYYKTIY